MLLVIKFATVVGLVASPASWVANQHDATSSYGTRPHAQDTQAVIHEMVKPGEHGTHQMPFNICLNGCSFFSLVSGAH